MTKHSVNLWGSHPTEGNDDCWAGCDFDSWDEAFEFYNDPWQDPQFAQHYKSCTAVIELLTEGSGEQITRDNPDYNPTQDTIDDWQREIAREAGMMGGCDAYNDAMGY